MTEIDYERIAKYDCNIEGPPPPMPDGYKLSEEEWRVLWWRGEALRALLDGDQSPSNAMLLIRHSVGEDGSVTIRTSSPYGDDSEACDLGQARIFASLRDNYGRAVTENDGFLSTLEKDGVAELLLQGSYIMWAALEKVLSERPLPEGFVFQFRSTLSVPVEKPEPNSIVPVYMEWNCEVDGKGYGTSTLMGSRPEEEVQKELERVARSTLARLAIEKHFPIAWAVKELLDKPAELNPTLAGEKVD